MWYVSVTQRFFDYNPSSPTFPPSCFSPPEVVPLSHTPAVFTWVFVRSSESASPLRVFDYHTVTIHAVRLNRGSVFDPWLRLRA